MRSTQIVFAIYLTLIAAGLAYAMAVGVTGH
jgi:hypothetical protein